MIGTLLLVEDDPQLRKGIALYLERKGFAVIEAGTVAEGRRLLAERDPAPAVVDYQLPDGTAFDLLDTVRERDAGEAVIVLTGSGTIDLAVSAIKAGAEHFLTKPVERDALIHAVRNALERDTRTRRSREQGRALREKFDALTPRERDVFVRVVSGKLNKQIAADLGTAERTVKAHRAHVMEKLNVASVAELVHVAEQLKAATHTPGE